MTTKKEELTFITLASIDVSKKVDTKNGLSYLPWAQAWGIVKQKYPGAQYEVTEYEDGRPYLHDEYLGYMVSTSVSIAGETLCMHLPVMDNYNNPILHPSSTDISNSNKRCLVKALAFHGLGINVYAGEDTVMFEDEFKLTEDGRKELVKAIRSHMDKDTSWANTVFKHWNLPDVDAFSDEQIVTTHDRIPTQEKK